MIFVRPVFLALAFLLATMGPSRAAVFFPSHFTLSNGLQIVVVPNHLSPVVSQMVWYKVGAADEVPGKNGLAHYLEHLMFRGTDTVGPGEFAKIIAAQGGVENAFTSFDYTAYYEEVAASRLPMIMQMEADRMQHLHISKETAEPELHVVLNERQERTDNSPEGRFFETFQSKFMPHYAYGRPVIGWKKEIENLSAADARKFYETWYAPNNAVVVISGDIRVEDVMSLAAATYGRVAARKVPERRDLGPVTQTLEHDFTSVDGRISQPEVVWRFAAPSRVTRKDGSPYAYEVLAEVLDGGESGILYQKLVTELGLASAIEAGYDADARGETEFSIAASVNQSKSYKKLEEALHEALANIADKGIAENKVEDAKRRLQRSATFAREGIMMPGYAFGEALTTGQDVSDVEEWPDRINAVTVEQVNAALRELAASKRQLMGALLPGQNGGRPQIAQPMLNNGTSIR